MNTLKIHAHIVTAARAVLREKAYRLAFIPLGLVVLAFFVAIPTVTIPGNSLRLQFSLYSLQSYITLAVLSLLAALFVLMNVYAYKRAQAAKERFGVVAKGGLGGALGAVASIFGAASCPMCVAALFSFLGFGTVGFLVQYQWWVFFAALGFMLLALYFTSRKVNGVCASCVAHAQEKLS